MRSLLLLIAVLPCACAGSPPFAAGEWIDLSHAFGTDTIYWPTASGFELTADAKGMTEQGFWYEANSFRTAEHGGTHVDAPVHFAQGKLTTDAIPLARLTGPAVVVDVRERVRADPDYEVRVADLEAFEAQHGRIPDGAIVLLHTGFGARWPDRVRYLGTAERGLRATFELRFPGLHPSAARWLMEERAIDAVGIDTASIDHGKSRLFLSHRELFARDVPAFENVANLDRLPPTGAFVVALPMKIAGGSGGPLRIAAFVPAR
jgi:kynurenine formamidase